MYTPNLKPGIAFTKIRRSNIDFRRALAFTWAMLIRRRDAEAGADADAETQMMIDFEAEGSSTDAH